MVDSAEQGLMAFKPQQAPHSGNDYRGRSRLSTKLSPLAVPLGPPSKRRPSGLGASATEVKTA